jgi:hypothetical protein
MPIADVSMGNHMRIYPGRALGACGVLLAMFPHTAAAQSSARFLERAFGASTQDEPLRSPDAPSFSIMVAGRELDIERTQGAAARLTIGDIPLRFTFLHERQGGIDLYRLRHASDSELRGEQIRFTWTFTAAFNESMTFDTGALQGQPLYLPDGKIPANQFTNWGSVFYNQEANLAVGVQLDGAEPSRHARRGYSRFTKTSTLQLMAISGNPQMEITL